LGEKIHPQFKDKTIDAVFKEEQLMLSTLGRCFDGYVEKPIRVSSTCLVQYDSNHYSVPSNYAKQRVSLRAYADRIILIAKQQVIATHKRSFNKYDYQFEPWHYVPLLKYKPGALRDGAPFNNWDLPQALMTIKKRYLQRAGGDKDFVELLLLIKTYDMETVTLACELAIKEKTIHLAAIINLINRLAEPSVDTSLKVHSYPKLLVPPEANCHRYEKLRTQGGV
jgi:hypothetical protein